MSTSLATPAGASRPGPVADRGRATRTAMLLGRMRRIHAAAPAVPVAGVEDLATLAARRVLVIAPHPDDEVIGCGGLVWRCAERGADVTVLFLTCEGARSIAAPTVVAGVPLRVRESRVAQRLLGYALGEHVRLEERALEVAARDGRLRRAIAPRLAAARADVVLVPNLHEMHPDHRAAARDVLAVARVLWEAGALPELQQLLLYEIWGVCPRVDAALTLDAEARDVVRAALAAYRTQTATVDYQTLLEELRTARARALERDGAWVEAYQALRSPAAITEYLREAAAVPAPWREEGADAR